MKNYFLFFVICFSIAINAQDLGNKVPSNAPFALCLDGKNLSNKVAVNTIQEYPWMKDLLEKELQFLPKDLSQTGIDFNNRQYQYYINKDSVLNYVLLLPLNNAVQFEKIVQSKYGDSFKVKKQSTYNSASTSKNHHLAWNEKFAILVNAVYIKPYKGIYSDTEPYANLSSIDTTAVLVDSAAAVTDEIVAPQYGDEIKSAPANKKKSVSKKGKNKKGKKTKKVIEEPVQVEPTEEEIYAAQEKANAELEETNRKLAELESKKNDSIESLKIVPVVDLIFKDAFDSKIQTGANTTIFKNNNPKSDFYIFADLDVLTTQLLSSMGSSMASFAGIYKNGMLESNLDVNGYFEKDRIRLNQVVTPKNEETKKSYQAICDSKIDKNLLNYVGNNILGYYSMSMNTQAVMNYEYKVLKSTLNSVYQNYMKETSANETDVLIDAIALLLDEKAIAELIPGNAIFVLNDLKKVQREYTTYTYNENYEQIETKGTKDEISPDFTFLINTKNEDFVNKLLKLPLRTNKITGTDYQLTNGYYTIHFEKDDLWENLYFGLKNGVFMITSSKENVENLIQQKVMPLQSDFQKSISKNNMAVWFDIQKILTATKTELEKDPKANYWEIALKNAGEITAESKFKNGTIASQTSYTIKGEHTNSLQYFFDVINDVYTEKQKEKTIEETNYDTPTEGTLPPPVEEAPAKE